MQLKPRTAVHSTRGSIPLLAVCDYKQVEVRAAGTQGLQWRGVTGVGVATL